MILRGGDLARELSHPLECNKKVEPTILSMDKFVFTPLLTKKAMMRRIFHQPAFRI